ncbi:MAG: alginate export family protein [Leeuwenhoekiella sp.]
MKLTITLLLLLTLFSSLAFAQEFTANADIRSRFEYRHGFNNLFPDDGKPAAFVTQRSRINLIYGSEWLNAYISLQDVSTWGDTRQILPSDNNDSFSLFQAWVELKIDSNWSTKLGRQSIIYDDERVFGGLDWAMQGRFHDAALIKYNKESFNMDLGFAFSQEDQRITGTDYAITGYFTYKTMQFAHLQKSWGKTTASFLFLNNGFQKYKGDNNDIADGTYDR